MSIWISRSALLSAGLVVASCGGGGRFDSGTRGAQSSRASVVKQVTVTTDQVVVTGPSGFCVDPTSSRTTDTLPFVMLGSCSAIARNSDEPEPAHKALLTASIGAPASGYTLLQSSEQILTEFFDSDEGRRTLSRSGDPESVQVLDSYVREGIYFLNTKDSSKGTIPEVSQEEWRAYLDVSGRLVSLAVLGFSDAPWGTEDGRRLIKEFSTLIKQKSAGGFGTAAPATPATPTPAAAPVPAPPPPQYVPPPSQDTFRPERPSRSSFRSVGLFRRIMR